MHWKCITIYARIKIMKLEYNRSKDLWEIVKDGRKMPLVEFYISEREKSKKTIRALEIDISTSQNSIRHIEKTYSNFGEKRKNKSPGLVLRALEGLGYSIEIKKVHE